MALNTVISVAAAIAMLDVLTGLIDVGAGTGYIEIRTGSQPADVSVAASGTLLATLQCSATAFNGATDGTPNATATANAVSDDVSADAAGTAGWFRVYDDNNLAVMDGEVGTSGADMNLNAVIIAIGATVSVTSWTMGMPES